MEALGTLAAMRKRVGPSTSPGLGEATLKSFLAADPRLAQAIAEGDAEQRRLIAEFPDLARLGEDDLIVALQKGFVNFYPEDQRNPYVPVAARGPWLVTFHGAVLHDSGGYGMIGFGHAPQSVIDAMAHPHVMANVMTASFSQHRLATALRREIGHARGGVCPFDRFICMNSGSEAVTVATRISDVNAKRMTDPGGKHAGQRPMYLTVKGGFHGRTERPAQLSNSSQKAYKEHLASFRNLDVNHVVGMNDVAALEAAFAWAAKENVFFESLYLEPVMGEGDPGKALEPAFYQRARELSAANGTLLVVDSIQAGIRAQGVLSLVDYPGFTDLPPPDMETYSKAVNAGQFPLSILALTKSAAALYARGIYGNTKTANPRALDVATAVLALLTPAVRTNIRTRGKELLERFATLATEFPGLVRKVQGTGLLCSIDLAPGTFHVVGKGQLEEYLRRHGIGVIHGGENSLRFTPHFELTTKEVDMLIDALRDGFRNGPRAK